MYRQVCVPKIDYVSRSAFEVSPEYWRVWAVAGRHNDNHKKGDYCYDSNTSARALRHELRVSVSQSIVE